MDESQKSQVNSEHPGAESWLWVAIAWLAVGIPLGWGIWQTLLSAAKLFK